MSDSTNQRTGDAEVELSAAAPEQGDPGEERRKADVEQLALTARELASRLGISRAHVWKLLSVGRLPAPVRLGRAVRWDKRVIDAWLAAGAPSSAQWERIMQTERVRGES